MPNNSLALRPPNHHLCLTYLPQLGPNHLASGTKSGTVRTYDIRQRKPVHEWKAAREGGVGTIAAGSDENQIIFSDRSNLLGALDIRTGRLLYSYPNMSCTPHALLSLPTPPGPAFSSSPVLGLATVSSDATLRVHSIIPSKKEGEKGNAGNGRKAKVEAMVGGVGIANPLWNGWGEIAEPPKPKKEGAEDGEEDEEDDEDEDDDEVWEGMSEVEDADDGSDSEEEEEVKPKSKKKRS